MDMRLGKTLVAIRSIKPDKLVRCALIVAPYSALDGWQRELTTECQSFILLTGTARKRVEKLEAGFDALDNDEAGRVWFLINKEGYRVIGDALLSYPWDAVVCDESTFLKNPNAGMSEFFAENFRDSRWRICLSGTPAPEGEIEYFQQMKFLDESILGKNYWQWRRNTFVCPPGTHEWFIKKAGRERLTKQLAKHCFFLKRSDAGCDEPKVYEVRKIVMPPKIRKIYKTLEAEMLLEAEGKDTIKTIWTVQSFIWSRRLTGGFYDTEYIWKDKINALVEIVKTELAHEKIVVWSDFKLEGEQICKALGKCSSMINGSVSTQLRVKKRQQFINGDIRVLVCQPECFRHGVDLSCADTMIYFSSPLGLETRLQTEDRTIRIGKGSPALIIDMVVEDTIDEDILASIKRKETKSGLIRRLVQGAQRRCA